MRKLLLLLIPLFLLSFQSNAQFKKLIKHAKEKAIEAVLGEDNDSSQSEYPESATDSSEKGQSIEPAQQNATQQNTEKEDANKMPPTEEPKPIDFPKTGVMVTGIHGVFAPVLDGAAKKMAATPEGKYAFERARKKGLKGTNTEILNQLMETKNQKIAQEISEEVEARFPNEKPERQNTMTGNNPAWGGVSDPSLYFYAMVGSFDVWITPHHLKFVMNHNHPTMADAFGVNAASITNFLTHKIYSIGSVLGVKFAKVMDLDSVAHNMYGTYGLIKDEYMGIPGIKIASGEAGKFGKYNTISEKIVIPVRPFVDPHTGRKSDDLLYLHDVLSGKQDLTSHPHYDPSYTLTYEFFFTHDLDAYLSSLVKSNLNPGILGKEGICIGAKIMDENGNSANYRLINIQKDVKLDKGEFEVPEDYPVMTDEELKEAIKKHFSLKNMFKRAMKNGVSEDEK